MGLSLPNRRVRESLSRVTVGVDVICQKSFVSNKRCFLALVSHKGGHSEGRMGRAGSPSWRAGHCVSASGGGGGGGSPSSSPGTLQGTLSVPLPPPARPVVHTCVSRWGLRSSRFPGVESGCRVLANGSYFFPCYILDTVLPRKVINIHLQLGVLLKHDFE